jgi:Mg/Co/Ni transporter MgtE
MADLLEQLPAAERDVLVESLDTSLEAKTYTYLDDAVPEDII